MRIYADPVLGLSQHEIDVCSEYVHAFMGPAFRGFFLYFFSFENTYIQRIKKTTDLFISLETF